MAKNETVKKKKKKKRGRKKSLRSLYILVTLMLSAMLVFIIILIGSSVNGQKKTALAEVNKTPTPTFTSFLTPSPTPVETQTFTPSPVPTYTPVPTPSPTSTPTPTPVPTPTPEPTPVPTAVKLSHIYEIEVDKSKQVVTVFTVGETGYYDLIVKQFICSTGHCDKISNGWYKMGTKYNWKKMENGSYARYASRISGPYLFHSCCYYSENGGKLKTHYYTNLGKNASSGCIRLTAGDAYWIYKNCPEGTPIHVITSGAKDKELIEALKPPKLKGSWDPTDPDPKNPHYVEPVTTPIPTPALGVTPAPTPSWTVHPQLKAWGYC